MLCYYKLWKVRQCFQLQWAIFDMLSDENVNNNLVFIFMDKVSVLHPNCGAITCPMCCMCMRNEGSLYGWRISQPTNEAQIPSRTAVSFYPCNQPTPLSPTTRLNCRRRDSRKLRWRGTRVRLSCGVWEVVENRPLNDGSVFFFSSSWDQ